MSRELRPLEGIIYDYLTTQGDDDYDVNNNFTQFMVWAKQGLRELNYDVSKVVKSVRIPINTTLMIAEFPNDYIDYVKIGVLGNDGVVYSLGENQRINYAGSYLYDSGGEKLLDSDGIEILDEKDKLSYTNEAQAPFEDITFRNYYYNNNLGRLYGVRAGNNRLGEYRINTMDGRIELSSEVYGGEEIVLEYIADETMADNPLVPFALEQALDKYIYYRAVERKANVPASTKMMAHQSYVREKRRAKARMMKITTKEALALFNSRVQPAPKIGNSG